MRKLLLCVAASLAAAAVAAPSAGAARAFVLMDSDVGCFTDPGDIPGTGVIDLPRATQISLSTGGFVLECRGTLPAGVSFTTARTFVVSCNGVPDAARIVVTPSGRVTAFCLIPA